MAVVIRRRLTSSLTRRRTPLL
jgi:hypothetical protein